MTVVESTGIERIEELLGDDADALLQHRCETIDRSLLHLPGPDFVDRVFAATDRSNTVLRNLQWLFDSGRLGGTGYISILPVEQGIDHSGRAGFAPQPADVHPEKNGQPAHQGGC